MLKNHKKSLRGLLVLTVATILGGISGGSQAATATNSLAVTANVVASCVVNAGTLAFGTYSGTLLQKTGSFTMQCTNGTGYSIDLGNGQNYGTTRNMKGATSSTLLPYSLYQDSGDTIAWGTGAGGTAETGTANGTVQTISVYGQIPASTTLPPVDTYTDSVTITVTY